MLPHHAAATAPSAAAAALSLAGRQNASSSASRLRRWSPAERMTCHPANNFLFRLPEQLFLRPNIYCSAAAK